jgi:hypothetical protein
MASSAQLPTRTKPAAAEATLAKALAPVDIRPGDLVTPLTVTAEIPSYYWWTDGWSLPADQPVRVRFTAPSDGVPLKVESVCLPFVLTKQASGERLTLDLRKWRLARLDRDFARKAWKAHKKPGTSRLTI